MFAAGQYQLLDFGDGRRLEQFGPICLDRPCPAVEQVPRGDPAIWQTADARLERIGPTTGRWVDRRELPDRWTIAHDSIRLELKRNEFGHVGVFPEQAESWDWIVARLRAIGGPASMLNLFAHTGGSTLAAAAAGAEVVHVDSARTVVAWARRNAELSGLAEAPIRWIAEDAVKFVRRELRRGSGYDAVVLDPPSYGHGPRGEVWRLAKHLPKLLQACGALTAGRRRFILLTCHTPEFDAPRLERILAQNLVGPDEGRIGSKPLAVRSATARQLPSGVAVWWERAS
jgi:23S rRNA (cytosine1962-C5)-methyltransferase